MAKIKRDLKKKTIVEKTSTGKSVVSACTGNAALGDIADALARFATANAALSKALLDVELARSAAVQLTTVQENAEEVWNRSFEALCSAIESRTEGDATKVISAGLPIYVRGHKPELGRLPAPGDLSAKAGVYDGEVRLRWQNVPGRVAFVIELAEASDAAQVWRDAGTATKTSASIKNLVPGRQYWFRVAALGTAGRGPWSDPALCRAA